MSEATGIAGWVEAWSARQSVAPAVVLTRGRGEHLGLLASRCPQALIVSWVAQDAAAGREGRVVGLSAVQDRIGAAARGLLTLGLEVLRADPPSSLVPGPPSSAEFERAIREWSRQARVEQETLLASAESWQDHLAANLPGLMTSASVADLLGSLAGRPVLVVGSGPSRDGLLDALEGAADRCVLLATNSSVRALAARGLRPDGVVVIEGKDCSADLEGVPAELLEDVVLFAKASTHPAHLEWPIERRAVFLGPGDGWLAGWFGRSASLPTGGNAGTTALVLAWTLGGFPVLATGLDFALDPEDGAGRRGGRSAPTEPVLGWTGRRLEAEWPFVCYREQTEQILQAIRARDPQARFLSLSSRGARIAGMDLVAWPDLRDHLPRLGRGELARAFDGRRPRGGGAVGLKQEVARVLARFEQVAAEPLGPAIGLALLSPPDSLLRSLAGPALIQRPTRAAFEGARRRFEALAQRALDIAVARGESGA
ncbi:MAG: DUF115 domain-containing protein [Acidobacteriota bacterium]|nr:DUF115 domain-containing protein [Acidobacteriota bacterium]